MKASLSRPRTPRSGVPSPAGAAANPRLSSIPDARRRALLREPPQAEPPAATPRKENRVPSTAAAATTAPRLRALSRSRSSLKEYSDRSSSVRDSPRRPPPPRFQSPRPSHDGGAGDCPRQPVLAPTTASAVVPVVQSRQNRQVVLAEIKTAAAFLLRRSGNGAGTGHPASPSPRPVIATQVDGRRRPSDIGRMSNVEISRNSDIKPNNFSIDEGGIEDDASQSSVKPGSLKITGDFDTEPSYVYITMHSEEEAMNSSQPQPLAASVSNAEEPEAPGTQSEKETGDLEETAMASSEATAKESPATDQEDASPQSSDQSFYSNVDSSFSHRSELAASPTDSPLHGSPSSCGPSTEQLLEADTAMLRMKREEEEDDEAAGEIKSLPIPSTTTSSSSLACPVVAVQSPMEAVAGLKRFLTFGKKNVNIKAGAEAAAAAAVAPPADEDSVGQGWPSGDSVRPRICSSDAASDDSDNSYAIPAHVRSLQSCGPCSPAKPVLLKELISSANSPRANRSFFSFSSFKSRGY
ncbi:hypothetical protein E2562_029921 [Oryza meyeriana var. granulata]|uniref:Uncharacterized protein n=1 Tax=Oryza meyeriana var. granulata TaxID=110450 RepID=A0A6G1CUG7_9ORYZ|nr:hypothetical protein E2562_029921 [Oryza meyeriana var. granulata]